MSSLRTVLIGIAACVAIAIVADVILARPALHGGEDLAPASHVYPPDEPVACPAGSRPGTREPSEATTALGVGYVVKPPANYDPLRAHPLIVVYAPRGLSRSLSERVVGLTRVATTSGFIIAYADSRALDLRTIDDLATVPGEIATRWCIDERRVYLTGHSDGGTMATAAAVLHKGGPRPAAIAPSAAGFRREDLVPYACPPPVGVMVQHSSRDELFPDFGRGAADWWAACNGCDSRPEARADGCLAYPNCAAGGETLYCEGSAAHGVWPERNVEILAFFDRVSSTRAAPPDAESSPSR